MDSNVNYCKANVGVWSHDMTRTSSIACQQGVLQHKSLYSKLLKKKKVKVSIDRYSVCMCVSTSINTPIITAATVGVLELCPWWGQVMCKAFFFLPRSQTLRGKLSRLLRPLPHPHLLSGGFPPLVITWCVSPASSYLPEPLVNTYPYHSYLLAGPLSPVFFTLSVLCSFFFFGLLATD